MPLYLPYQALAEKEKGRVVALTTFSLVMVAVLPSWAAALSSYLVMA